MESQLNFSGPFVNLLIGLVIAIVTARVTVAYSMRRFYSEKLWERKAEAYSAILEALHYMKRSFEEDMDAEIMGREIEEDRKNELNASYKKSYDELRKRIDMGQFALSDEAIEELASFRKAYGEAKSSSSWFEHIDSSLSAINKTMNRMRIIAKTELEGY